MLRWNACARPDFQSNMDPPMSRGASADFYVRDRFDKLVNILTHLPATR
jgi:hypothetical protein